MQPALFLLLRTELSKNLHIASIGCRTVKDLRSPGHSSHNLSQWRVFKVCQTRAVLLVGQEEVPESFGLCLQLIHNLCMMVWIARGLDLVIIYLLVGINKALHKSSELLTQAVNFFRVGKIHSCCSFASRSSCLNYITSQERFSFNNHISIETSTPGSALL